MAKWSSTHVPLQVAYPLTAQPITQQIVVDNGVLAMLVVYHIDRVPDGTRSAPGLEIIRFQKYP